MFLRRSDAARVAIPRLALVAARSVAAPWLALVAARSVASPSLVLVAARSVASPWLVLVAALLVAGGCGDHGRPPGEVLVPRDASWRFSVDPGQVADGAWLDPAYDDAAWPAGEAPLGFGEDDLATTTPRPMDRKPAHLSTWLRHVFEVPDPDAYRGLVVRFERDDGVELWLNGTPIVESNLPVLASGPAGPEVGAPMAVGGDDEDRVHTLAADPALLRRGRNVLAAQVRQERPESSDQRFVAALVGVRPGDPAVLLRGPYLQRPTGGSVVVRFLVSRSAPATVRYGPPGSARAREVASAAPARDHELVLDGLAPGEEITYEVRVDGEPLAGGGPYRFRMPPGPDAEGPLRIVAVGDGGSGDDTARAVASAIARVLEERPADAWILLGDYAYPTGSEAEIQNGFFDVFGRFFHRIPAWPVMGNHEEKRSLPPEQTGPHFDVFTLPTQGESGGVPSGTEAYYAFDVGPVHVLALDSSDHGHRIEGPMIRWAREDLESARDARWRIAYLHHAPHSGGTHGSGDGHQMRMRSRVMPTLEAGGVDLVLAGHSHAYERSFLMHGLYAGPEALRPTMILDRGEGGVYHKAGGVAPGTVYVVAGMGSQPGEGAFDHPAMATFAEGLAGAVVIDVDGCRLTLRAFDTDARDFDRFELDKGPPCEAP